MKKIVLTLTVLMLAAPALAVNVTITATQVGDTNEVAITYVTDGNLPRAFGLDITVTDGNIVGIKDYNVGECNSVIQGYGIFPGTIDVNVDTGEVNDFGSPVAPQSDLPGDTLGGLDTNGITIEMGSLYTDGNAPDTSGTLCKIIIGDTTSCDVNLAGNASRADVNGVVMENPDEVPNVTFNDTHFELITDCMKDTNPQYNDWVTLGKPDCWCYCRQCRGDADGTKLGPFWVSAADLGIFRSAFYKMLPQIPPGGICGDLDHQSLGPFRVNAADLAIFRQYFYKMVVPTCDATHYNFWCDPVNGCPGVCPP